MPPQNWDYALQTSVNIITGIAGLVTVYLALKSKSNTKSGQTKIYFYMTAVLISFLSILSNDVGWKEAIKIPIISMAPLGIYEIFIWLLEKGKQAAWVLLIGGIAYIIYLVYS
jgi:hypothetical protein